MNAAQYYHLGGAEEISRVQWKQELFFRAKWQWRDLLSHAAHLLHPCRVVPTIVIAACLFIPVLLWRQQTQLKDRARRGEPEAQYQVGRSYFDHANRRYDYSTAVIWFGRAAIQHHAKAQSALGMSYAQGLGVRVNYPQAVKWLRQAAEQGECLAQNQLGLLYAQGKGTTQNLAEAMKWFKKAADKGFEPARRNWAFTAAARRHFLAKITTRSGTVYSGATLQKIDHDGITLQFAPEAGGVGMAKLRFSELPQDLQQLLKCDDDKSSHRYPAAQLLAASSQPL